MDTLFSLGAAHTVDIGLEKHKSEHRHDLITGLSSLTVSKHQQVLREHIFQKFVTSSQLLYTL